MKSSSATSSRRCHPRGPPSRVKEVARGHASPLNSLAGQRRERTLGKNGGVAYFRTRSVRHRMKRRTSECERNERTSERVFVESERRLNRSCPSTSAPPRTADIAPSPVPLPAPDLTYPPRVIPLLYPLHIAASATPYTHLFRSYSRLSLSCSRPPRSPSSKARLHDYRYCVESSAQRSHTIILRPRDFVSASRAKARHSRAPSVSNIYIYVYMRMHVCISMCSPLLILLATLFFSLSVSLCFFRFTG